MAGLTIHSSNYDWLVINQNSTNAQFKGSGTFNGIGEYKFMLWAGDGEPDSFRIKIWEEEERGLCEQTYPKEGVMKVTPAYGFVIIAESESPFKQTNYTKGSPTQSPR